MVVHAELGNVFHRAALSANTWNQQERMGRFFAYLFEHGRSRGPHDEHESLGTLESLAFAQHFTVQRTISVELEILCPRIGRQREQDGPTTLERRERLDAVPAHVRHHSHGIGPKSFKHGACIPRCGVANVATLRIGNHQDVTWNLFDHALQGSPPRGTVLLEEGQVGFVRYRHVLGGLNHGQAKSLHALNACTERSGNLGRVGIKTYAEIGTFGMNGGQQPLWGLQSDRRRTPGQSWCRHAAKVGHGRP